MPPPSPSLCTVLETAKLHDVDPAAYLRAAVIAADRGEVLLPWQFHDDGGGIVIAILIS